MKRVPGRMKEAQGQVRGVVKYWPREILVLEQRQEVKLEFKYIVIHPFNSLAGVFEDVTNINI